MWYKKRNKMDITSVVFCGLVLLLIQQSVVAHDTNITSENDRYPKDDGVAKLGFESSYDQSEEKEDKTHFRNTQIGQEDVKKPGDVEIIEERKEIPKIDDVKTTQSEELNDMVTSEINRSALLKELAHSLAGKSAAFKSSKSTSQELRGKEKRLIPLEDVDSSSSETRALKQQGVPFFIADDGKSIQLPQSDVIYNTETGEILIRNRVTADKMKAEAEMASAEVKTQSNKNGYFNIRPDGIGFKNLQGFVIADNEGNSNRPLLYPVAEDSKESGSHEVHLRRKGIESEERKTNESRKNLDAAIKKEAIGTLSAAIEAPPKINEEALLHVDNKNVSSTDDKALNGLILADLQKTPVVLPVTEATTQKSIEETKKDIVFNAPDENNRSAKQVSSNTNSNENMREQQSNENSPFPIEQINHSAFRSDEEPIYKISTTTESTVIANRFGNLEDHYFNGQGYIRPDIVVSNVDEHNKKHNSGESKTRPTEYNHKTFLEEDQQQNNSIKKLAHEEIIQKSNTNQEKIDEILAKPTSFDIERTLITNEEILKRIAEEMIIVNTNPGVAKMSFTTTTEQPDPLMVLRSYLEDIYLRGPIAIVVDVEAKNLMKTRDVWTSMEAYGGNLNITDAVLFGYDDNGITSMSYHKGLGANRVDNDDKSLAKALYGMTATSKYTSSTGNPGVALNKAVHLLPYDSAVFLFEGAARAEPLSQPGPSPRLIKQLLTKRIKLYTVSSPSAWSASAALASGGAALSLTGTSRSPVRPNQRELRALSVYYDSSDEEELVFDEQQTLLIYNEVVEPRTFRFPVDSSITTLTVILSETPQVASLEGPRGIQIDLLDEVSVTNFSAGSIRSSGDPGGLTATLHLVRASPILEEELLGQSEPFQGTWKLIILSNVAYDVSVTADTPLRIMAKLIPTYPEHGPEVQTIKIAVGGTVASIEDGDILDATGRNISKLVYGNPDDNSESDATEIESLRALESGTIVKRVGVPEVLTPGTVFRVQVEGKNDRDEEFVRVSAPLTAPDNYEAETISTVLPASGVLGKQMVLERGVGSIEEGRAFNSTPSGQQVMLTVQDGVPMTAIQIGSSSRLYGNPGAQIQIHFEVTNNRENAVYFRFGAKDDQYFLRSMQPLRQWINAGQTANVVVTVGITSSAENNVRDTITFTANGLEPANLSTYVYVETDGRITSDRSRPSLKHEFRGDCQGYLGSDCATRTWGLDIIAKDTDSGLMRIGASPGTVVYPSGHYAGGREESRARYTASCCQQTVVISAVDVAGNIASYEVNVSQYFTPATIAAIVLGVLLFIALVVVIALLIRMCIKRRRASRDLPSYSTQRATRTTTP